jgi:hypothetical protein
MKRLIVAALTVLAFSLAGMAQKPGQGFVGTLNDFAGKWAIDTKASQFGNGTANDIPNYTISIEIDSDKLTMTREYDVNRQHVQLVYDFDLLGRGETNTFTVGEMRITDKSKTTVKNNRITRKWSTKETWGYTSMTENYRLLDANTLVFERTQTTSMPFFPQSYSKYVLHRVR